MAVKAGATPEVQFEVKGLDLTFIAGEALTGHQYKPLYLSAERTVKLMTEKDGSQHFIGFMQSGDVDSSVTIASGDHVSVRISGITYVVAQSSFAMHNYLMVADSQGRVGTASDNYTLVGMALEAASIINHIVTALILNIPIKGDNT